MNTFMVYRFYNLTQVGMSLKMLYSNEKFKSNFLG